MVFHDNAVSRPGHFPCGSVDWNPGNSWHIPQVITSLPLRKCGLKPIAEKVFNSEKCHFPCGSVDWNILWLRREHFASVTSLAEVWIETVNWFRIIRSLLRHFPCGSVDWNRVSHSLFSKIHRHFPCGSVDWNCLYAIYSHIVLSSLPLRKCGLKHFLLLHRNSCQCHFPCGSVDWNHVNVRNNIPKLVTSLAEVWIETSSSDILLNISPVTSLAEVWIETLHDFA